MLEHTSTEFISLVLCGVGTLFLIGALLEHMTETASRNRKEHEQTGEFGKDPAITQETKAITELELNTKRFLNSTDDECECENLGSECPTCEEEE